VSEVIVVTPEQLRALVREAVSEALDARDPAQAPTLLDRSGLAKALGCSESKVDALKRRGMPCVRLGASSPRFELARCLVWLEEHDAP
jgi:hypothetical protein